MGDEDEVTYVVTDRTLISSHQVVLLDDVDDDDDGRGAKRVRVRGPVYDRGDVKGDESDEDDLDERRAEAKRMAAAEGSCRGPFPRC